MKRLTRRAVLGAAGAVAALAHRPAFSADPLPVPESGARLRVLRWTRFVEGEGVAWMRNTAKFTEQTGVQVQVDSVSNDDLRPKAMVAAQVGAGPDVMFGLYDDPHQFPDKLVDVSDVAAYLGGKYGGFYPVAERYSRNDGRWIALPLGVSGGTMNYRVSWMREAGFNSFPADMDGFLKLCQALKKNNHPVGFALGNAAGDTAWCYWLLWAFGGKVVNEQNEVVLDAPETLRALEYGKELYQTFIPGTLSWLDPSNNKAFIDGQISVTNNGISIYYAAKNSNDPALRAMAADIDHAKFPVGPVGRSTELSLLTQVMIFKHTKFPNAAKAYLRFMFEQEQYEPWQQASLGYISQSLRAYEANKIWTEDPKVTPFRDVMSRMLDNGYAGRMSYASAATMADFIVPNMMAEALTGTQPIKDAMQRAQKRAERYYKL
jgi:multiple sugar transport system substrate-binding protein